MTVLAAKRDRKTRGIIEPAGCAVNDLRDHGQRPHGSGPNARRQQQVGIVHRTALGCGRQVAVQAPDMHVGGPNIMVSGHDQVWQRQLRRVIRLLALQRAQFARDAVGSEVRQQFELCLPRGLRAAECGSSTKLFKPSESQW